jgi:hypothetical protein
MLGESIKIMLPTATGLVKQISFGGLGRRKCQSIRKAFPYVKGALSSLKKWISRQYLHLVQAENICLKSALQGKSDVSLITGRSPQGVEPRLEKFLWHEEVEEFRVSKRAGGNHGLHKTLHP